MLRLVRKYTFIEAELDEGLQEYRPPFGPKTEVQCYVNDYTPQSTINEVNELVSQLHVHDSRESLRNSSGQYDTVLANLPRSNNMVEGWHNGFQSLVGTTNPTLWTFLSALKTEETLSFKKKLDWRMRRAPEPQKKKWRDHTSRLNALVEDFNIDTEPLDYLFCLGELLSSV